MIITDIKMLESSIPLPENARPLCMIVLCPESSVSLAVCNAVQGFKVKFMDAANMDGDNAAASFFLGYFLGSQTESCILAASGDIMKCVPGNLSDSLNFITAASLKDAFKIASSAKKRTSVRTKRARTDIHKDTRTDREAEPANPSESGCSSACIAGAEAVVVIPEDFTDFLEKAGVLKLYSADKKRTQQIYESVLAAMEPISYEIQLRIHLLDGELCEKVYNLTASKFDTMKKLATKSK